MDRNIKEQDEIVVSRITENEAAGDHLNDIDSLINEHDSLINEHNLLNHKFSCEVVRDAITVEVVGDKFVLGCEAVGDVLRLSLPAEAENAAQVSNNSVKPMTPLHIAALQGRVDAVQNLIHHGADVHAEDEHGCTALHIAAQKGDYHCLKVLIEAGADAFASIGMSCKATAFRKLGASALITAVQHNHIDCVQELLQYGVDSDAVDEKGRSFRDIVAEKAINNCISACLKTDNEVRTDVHVEDMLRYRIREYVHELLLIGSFDKYIKRNGISELCKLMSSGIEDGDVEILKVFILESYSIDHNIPRGLTTLRHLSFEYYNSKIAAILITCFADIVIKNELLNMNIIEYLLCAFDRFEILKFVVKCIPWVPHINSLTALPIVVNKLPNHQFHDASSENFVLPPNVAFVLECDQTCIYVAIHDREKELTELELIFRDIVRGNPKYGRYPLKQPLINLIDKRISEEIDQLDLIIEDPLCENFLYVLIYGVELKKLKKYLWCEKIASNPPTLQQCCRYSLLKCLGPLNVENIRKLPLPNELQSYLLLQ